MRKMALALMVLAVCAMMVAPGVMAAKGPGGGGGSGSYSTMTNPDFKTGDTLGRWKDGNTRWFVMFWYASNQLPPGGQIDINNVPTSVSSSGKISWTTHGESLTLPCSLNNLAAGKTYKSPGDIAGINFQIQLWNWDPPNTSNHMLYISLNVNKFGDGQYINIYPTKDSIRFVSSSPLPFDYIDYRSPISTGSQSLDITIDR